jgi:hypothetical protein
VVLAGAAGVGKTRLAGEALVAAERRGAAARWAAGTGASQGLPLGAFAALLETVGGDPAQVLRRATEALVAGAGRAGVVVAVDDAHLLDELSAVPAAPGRRGARIGSAAAGRGGVALVR